MESADSRQRFFVSPSSFDNIGKVLKAMGEGFAHDVLGWGELKHWQATGPRDVLFLNCAMRFGFGYSKKIAGMIGDFVAAGGTLYASDWAMRAVQRAFPKMLKLDSLGEDGKTKCDVVDRGLQEMIGKRINIEFDMGSWRRIARVDSSVRVFVAAAGKGSANASAGLPIVVGFRHGRGNVLCTSFHNKAQTSDQERRLLRFLVLQPILASAAADATQAIEVRQFQPGQQIFSTINHGQTSPPFIFDAAAGQSLLYFVNWSSAARLRLIVKDPSGNLHFDRLSNQAPLGCEVARAAAGRWTCEIVGTEVPHDNFPFVLTLAAGTTAKLSVPLAPAQSPADAATSVPPLAAKTAGAFHVPPPPPPRHLSASGIPQSSLRSGFTIPPPPPPKRPHRGQ